MARRSCLGAGVNILGNNLLGSRTLSAEHRDLQFTAAVSASKLVQADALKKISVDSDVQARTKTCAADMGHKKTKVNGCYFQAGAALSRLKQGFDSPRERQLFQ